MVFGNERLAALKKDRLKLSIGEVRQFQARMRAECKALPEEKKQRFEADAKAARHRDRDDIKPECARGFQPDPLGLSSEHWPISPAVTERVIRAELQRPADSAPSGVSSFWHGFREKCSHRWYVRDVGAVGATQNTQKS